MTNMVPPKHKEESYPRLIGFSFWAYADLFYGFIITFLAWNFIPSQTARLPQVPWLLISWGGLHIVLGIIGIALAMFSTFKVIEVEGKLNLIPSTLNRLIWRLNVLITLVSVLLGLTLSTLCLMSGLYWLGVFGVLGWGVFISSLLLISGVLQILFLYPTLKLRRLLSKEYRLVFKGGGVPLRCLKLTLFLAMCFGLLGAYHGQVSTLEKLPQEQRDQVTRYLRSTLEGSPLTPANDQIGPHGVVYAPVQKQEKEDLLSTLSSYPHTDLLFVSFYAGGERIVRVSGRGPNLAKACEDAAQALASHPKLIGKRLKGGRLVVDRVLGEKAIPLSTIPIVGEIITALSVDPGVDGLRSRLGGGIRTILPSDLIETEKFGVAPIVPGIPELRFGVDVQSVSQRLGNLRKSKLFRIRTEQWVEKEELEGPQQIITESVAREPTALTVRGQWGKKLFLNNKDPRKVLLAQRKTFMEAAHLGGEYLVNNQQEDGRFAYQYFPYRDKVYQPSDNNYSVPRHAGAIYGLALLYEDQTLPVYKTTAQKAIGWLRQYALSECGGWSPQATCIPKINSKGQIATLGNSALSALALLTYLEKTKDSNPELIILCKGLLEFLSLMQREDGDFYHRYLLYDGSVEPRERGMFASEQAAFAMVLAARLWPKENWLEKAEKALDALTIHKYESDFLSAFFYGADHWTCLAAEAAFPLLKKREYLDFCLGYTRFLQRLQYRHELGEGDRAYHGHYGFGFLSPPQAPATGGFTEGVMGTLLLAEAHQLPFGELKDIYAQV